MKLLWKETAFPHCKATDSIPVKRWIWPPPLEKRLSRKSTEKNSASHAPPKMRKFGGRRICDRLSKLFIFEWSDAHSYCPTYG